MSKELYRSSFSSAQGGGFHSQKPSWAWKLIDIPMRTVMALMFVLTLLIVIIPSLDPEQAGVLTVLPLIAPFVFLVDIITTLYWLVRWKKRALLLSLPALITGLMYMPRYYNINIEKQYPKKYAEKKLRRVMTFNVANGNNRPLIEYILEQNPDILCLQEVLREQERERNVWPQLEQKYHSTFNDDTSQNYSCEILTTGRILHSGEIDSIPRYNTVWADLVLAEDTLRVLSLHMQSTSINPDDTQYIEHGEYLSTDNLRGHKLLQIISHLSENNIKRRYQADMIRQAMDSSPYPVIVCGDFNDVPLSYSYRIISRGMKDAFSEAGNGYPYTFSSFFKLLRIDYILLDGSMDVISYDADTECALSDHYPVLARFTTQSEE